VYHSDDKFVFLWLIYSLYKTKTKNNSKEKAIQVTPTLQRSAY
jgi:hypothetical protein